MAIPTAIVTVQLMSLDGLPAAAPGAGNTRYARATFQAGARPTLVTGRSRPIPDAGGTFDISAEASVWKYEVGLDPGTDINISVELREDWGDNKPPAAMAIVSGKISDPWVPGTVVLGAGPIFKVSVTTKLVNPTDKAFLARAAKAKGISGVLGVAQGYFVEIESIDGLYQPDPAAAPPTPGSKKVAGYASEDNLGRIFTNRKADGTWLSDTQFIDVAVKVTAFGGVTIPAGAKIRWTLDDIDDPTNDSPDFHREWGKYVDANDYDGAGKPLGAHPADNAGAFSPGNADEDKLLGSAVRGNARWAQAPGGPAPAPVSRSQAQCPITLVNPKLGKSSVRIHCPNVLGANFALRIKFEGALAGRRVFDAFTGVMTMWSRIDAEVVAMDGAHSVAGALAAIPAFFVPACVQLDFQLERKVSGALNKSEMAAAPGALSASTAAWVNNPAVFTHNGSGGWFFLGAARFPIPLPGSPPPLFTGSSYTFGTGGTDVWVEVSGNFPTADYVSIKWTDGFGNVQNTGFRVDSVTVGAGKSRIFLDGNDVTPGFTGHDADGSLSHAYATQIELYPQHTLSGGVLSAGGFGIPNAGATVKIDPAGAVFTTGISPSVPNAVTGVGSFFAGRTVLFTHTPKFSTPGPPPAPKPDYDLRVLSTVVHEFLHAFGMPHKCGFWDWRTPRLKSCCMNYFDTWLLDPAQHVVPGTVRKNGNDMCGRHLMEVRRVHLDKNPGLNW